MRRREFITLLGGAAAAWPVAARGQQPDRVRRIGLLMPSTADDPLFQPWIGAFLQELGKLGWAIGRNVRIDTRWSATDPDLSRRYATELVALAPDVLLAHGTSTIGPLLQTTRVVPIVFPVLPDPVAAGFVDSLSRPGATYWFHVLRVQPERQMAGAAEANRAERDASGGPSGCHARLWNQYVCCHPDRGTVAQG